MTTTLTPFPPQTDATTPLQSALITLNILETRVATDGNLPSHLHPGTGSDTAWFQVTSQPFPDYNTLNAQLIHEDCDYSLMEYNEITGAGYFVAVDAYAPPAGILRLSSL